MNKQIENIRRIRLYLVDLVKDLPVESVNQIPEGCNNNIIWNLGHMVAAQQGVCYVRPGLQTVVEEQFYLHYKPGSRPAQIIGAAEIDNIKELMFSTLDRLLEHLSQQRFTQYPPWTTRYGVQLNNIDEAMDFLLFHEGLHAGTVITYKKLVRV